MYVHMFVQLCTICTASMYPSTSLINSIIRSLQHLAPYAMEKALSNSVCSTKDQRKEAWQAQPCLQ